MAGTRGSQNWFEPSLEVTEDKYIMGAQAMWGFQQGLEAGSDSLDCEKTDSV